MKLNVTLPKFELKPIRTSVSKGRTVFVQWDRQTLSYLVVQKDRQSLKVVMLDQVEREAETKALSQLGELLKRDKMNAVQVVVLLSRVDLQMANIALPPAQSDEIPDLVRAQVEEHLGDSEQPPAIDYVLGQFSENAGGEALAFAVENPELLELQAQAKGAGLRLVGVIPRSLASWGLLGIEGSYPRALSLALTRFDSEIELMILHRGVPRTVRTIRTRTDDMQVLAEQVTLEIQRCLAVEESADVEEAMHLFIFGDQDIFKPWVELFAQHFDGPVSLLNPLESFKVSDSVDREDIHQFAALCGAAKSYFSETVPVNLTLPKRAPKPPNPMRRWAFMGAAVAAAVLAVIYVLATEMSDLEAELAEKKKRFKTHANMARKRQEKADDVSIAERWLKDEVNWLEQLKLISDSLPSGQDVTVRRLTAATASGRSVVDLGVQVSQPEKVAELENRLRTFSSSVVSKRVSEQSGDQEYPWQFETRIAIPFPGRELVDPNAAEMESEAETPEEVAAAGEAEGDSVDVSQEQQGEAP